MKVDRVEGKPTITISGLSEDMAEKLMAFVGNVYSSYESEEDALYNAFKKALGKGTYERSKYTLIMDDKNLKLVPEPNPRGE